MMERVFRLGLDLDQVVFDYVGGLREFCKKVGKVVPDEEPKSFQLHDCGWFASRKEFVRFHGWAVEEGLYENLELIPGAFESLWRLSDDGVIIDVVTSRFVVPGQHEKVVEQTAKALERNRIPFSNACFLTDKTLYRADLNIDDGPHNIIALENSGMPVITMATSYNEGIGKIRAANWEEAEKLIQNFRKASE